MLLLALLIVGGVFSENSAWGIFAEAGQASGKISAQITANTGGNEGAWQYDASGYAVASKGRAKVKQFDDLEFRAVRDLNHIDESTLRAMKELGFAPKNISGDKLVHHHHRQNPAGPIIEIPAKNHKIGNPRQHPFGNQKGRGLTPEERAASDRTKVEYWKERAAEELRRRGLK